MRLPNLPYAGNKAKKSSIEWKGLNRKALIADDEFSYTQNLSTKDFPLISPRPSREVLHTLTVGNALFASTQLAWVDGTSFLYNGVSKGSVTSGEKSMVELSQRIVIFPDKKSYDVVGDSFSSFGSGDWYTTPPTAGSVPDIQYACVLDNRIWGVDNKDNICCTALGDYDDWTTFSSPSEATDAWSVDTGTNGNFTGIASYKGTNVVFKRDHVWKRFGDIPSDFQFVEISSLGCLNHKSICEVNNILFWLSPQGVVAYTGGVPEVISENLNENYVSAVGGSDGRRYYLSLFDGEESKLYVYDTWKGIWLHEDIFGVTDFANFDGSLYALSDNKVVKFGSGAENVQWKARTKEYTEEMHNKKGHSELLFRVDLEANSSLEVYVRIDNGSFKLVKSYSVPDLSSFTVPIKIERADHFQVEIVGNREGRIHQFTRKFYVGSET